MKNTIWMKLSFLMVLIISCSSGNDSINSVDVSGNVAVTGSVGNADVSVELYEISKADPDLSEMTAAYPFIGTELSQNAIFDHLDEVPFKATSSNESGQWTLQGAKKGRYNLVISKPGYGFIYRLDIDLSIDNIFDFVLFPVDTLKGLLSVDYVFQSDMTYFIEDNLTIMTNHTLTIQPGAIITLASAKKLVVEGNLIIEKGDPFPRFIAHGQPGNIWGSIRIPENSQCERIDNLYMSDSNLGIELEKTEFEIANTIFHNSQFNGITLNGAKEVRIRKSHFVGGNVGIYMINSDSSSSIEECFFYELDDFGIELERSSAKVKNNVLFSGLSGILCNNESDSDISGNHLKSFRQYGIQITRSSPRITENIFENAGSRSIYIPQVYPSQTSNSLPVITGNNFSGATYHVWTIGFRQPSNSTDINAKNNWWNTTSVNEIWMLIHDVNDLPPNDPQRVTTGHVIFEPFLTTANEQVGPKNLP